MIKKFFRNVLLILILSFSFISISTQTFAETKGKTVEVIVTEPVPGANCTLISEKEGTREYKCEIETGFKSVVKIMGAIIKYFTFIAGLGGVLFIVYNGIMYSMGGMEQSLKDDAKKRIVQTIIGLIVLFLSGVILNIVAPWIYTT